MSLWLFYLLNCVRQVVLSSCDRCVFLSLSIGWFSTEYVSVIESKGTSLVSRWAFQANGKNNIGRIFLVERNHATIPFPQGAVDHRDVGSITTLFFQVVSSDIGFLDFLAFFGFSLTSAWLIAMRQKRKFSEVKNRFDGTVGFNTNLGSDQSWTLRR